MSDQSHDRRDEGTTVAEAARVLGITEGAVRKRVERGKLAAERTTDGRLIVHLERDTTATDTTRQSRVHRYTRGLEAEVEYLRRLLEDEREARTEERRRHDTLMAQLMQRIPELEAPSEARESPESASEPVATTETPPEPAEQEPHKEESSPPQGQDSLVAPRPRWLQIGVAVLLAGSITTIPQAMLIATGGFPTPQFVYVFLHSLVLLCGLWAGLAWPGRHTKGLVALGSLAGLLDLAINWSIFHLPPPLSYFIPRASWSPVNVLDLLSDIGIAALFTAGGLYGNLIESQRIPRKRGEESVVVREIAEKASGPRRQPSETTLKLLQALGPSILALIGVILGLLPGLLDK